MRKQQALLRHKRLGLSVSLFIKNVKLAFVRIFPLKKSVDFRILGKCENCSTSAFLRFRHNKKYRQHTGKKRFVDSVCGRFN